MEMTAENAIENVKPRVPTEKILLWVAIASIVMLFAGLTSGYVVRQAEGNWLVFEIPTMFYISTVAIILSSITMQMSIAAIRKDNKVMAKNLIIITLGLGLAFVFCQFMGWSALVDNNIHFVGTPSESFFYALTGLHLAHLAFGLIGLMVTAGKSILQKYSSKNYLGISLCAIYWHFLGGLWLYLFVFLAIFR
ncbi:MAG TPA: cytochrome c oxidase subunit 3 [Bacteroidia bacterium]|jgi:cytochrome c oxidase subunit 3|nr:cytochrome c oxidase subunit 3 [Bacteroidia bacterium]